jgi:hypothetical protein
MKLEPLMTIAVDLEPPLTAGATPLGEVRLLSFKAGTFSGVGLKGVLLPGGTDWQLVRADGVFEIRAHYLLETEEAERIEVDSRGIRHATEETLARISRGEHVEPTQYYFRTAMRFNTGAPRLAYLTRLLAVARGERMRDSVRMSVFAVP